MRLFLAINLPADVRAAIAEAVDPLRTATPGFGWSDPAKVHLTVKFLGEQPESVVDPLREAIERVAARHEMMDLDIGGVGAFPNLRRPRVVWLGVTPAPKLELLHHDVEVACEALGFEVEGRAFRPHLTLARIRERATTEETRALARAAREIDYRETVTVESIDLMRSHLSSAGARYDPMWSARLRESA